MASNHKLTSVIGGRTVQAIRQQDQELMIDFADGSTMRVLLKEPTSSVMVRDKNGKLEYAD